VGSGGPGLASNRSPFRLTRRDFSRVAGGCAVGSLVSTSLVRGDDTEGAAGRFTLERAFDGLSWRAHLHVPGIVEDGSKVPLVLFLHGSGSSGPVYLDRAGWAAEAERSGFIVVAPDAQRMRPLGANQDLVNPRRWNSGQLKAESNRSTIDDVAYLVTLLDDVAKRWPVNRKRVFVAGHSNGGSMAFRLINEKSERFTAMASVAGHCWVDDPSPKVPLPTLFMVGDRDPLMPIAGGRTVLPWEVRDTPPFRWTTTKWAKALGCPDDQPIRTQPVPEVSELHYGKAPNGAELLGMIVWGQGHQWPGAPNLITDRIFLGPNIKSVDATATVWKFFDRYSRR
jgi:polyhydroxybutyrate depolymerase